MTKVKSNKQRKKAVAQAVSTVKLLLRQRKEPEQLKVNILLMTLLHLILMKLMFKNLKKIIIL